jgi:hypothetical protein
VSVHDGRYGLVLAFDTDDQEFLRGFEAASVYCDARSLAAGEQVHEDDKPGMLRATVHATNAEMMLRIAEAHGLHVRSEDIAEGWLEVTFTRTPDCAPQP